MSLSNTFLNVSLSTTLSAQLQSTANSGFVYMDALWFDQSNVAHWVPMVEQSQLTNGGSYSIQLPQTTPTYSGKLFFLISSVANTQITDPLSGYNPADTIVLRDTLNHIAVADLLCGSREPRH